MASAGDTINSCTTLTTQCCTKLLALLLVPLLAPLPAPRHPHTALQAAVVCGRHSPSPLTLTVRFAALTAAICLQGGRACRCL